VTTIAVDAVYAVEIDKIPEFRLGSLDTLVAPATIVPSRDGDVHDLKEPRGISPNSSAASSPPDRSRQDLDGRQRDPRADHFALLPG
jgi:hypothetical protein